MSETERRKAAEEMKARARENMREIYRNSGHGFSAADIQKLCDDSSQEINQWAAFAANEADSALLEAAGLVCHLCRQGSAPVQLDGKWFHENPPMKCEASPIHERRALK
jgi:hypothetical protein